MAAELYAPWSKKDVLKDVYHHEMESALDNTGGTGTTIHEVPVQETPPMSCSKIGISQRGIGPKVRARLTLRSNYTSTWENTTRLVRCFPGRSYVFLGLGISPLALIDWMRVIGWLAGWSGQVDVPTWLKLESIANVLKGIQDGLTK